MVQVAAVLGVSPSTVSNAYNRPDQLSAALRERVFAVAEQLGYGGPDPVGRRLRRGGIGMLGLLFAESVAHSLRDAHAVAFVEGLAEGWERRGGGLVLLPGQPGADSAPAVREAVVDAFCMFSIPAEQPAARAVQARRLPLVCVDEPRLDDVPFVGIDDRSAARAAAEHLVRLGHRRVAIVLDRLHHDDRSGPADAERQASAITVNARARLAGYRDALDAVGAEVTVYEAPPSSIASGRRAGEELLAARPRPTAIAAISDAFALGLLDAAARHGLRVPRQLSVVGFDDIPAAQAAGLTTIRQPAHEKGRLAAQLLLDHADAGPGPHLLPVALTERATTAPPPRRRRNPGSTGGH